MDVAAAAERYLDVEWTEIPASCDGLVLGLLGPRPRPLVLLDSRSGDLRQRFTLAHELGHVMLPWHVGQAFLCDPDALLGEEGLDRSKDEPEANRFAGELLLPTAWLSQRLASARGNPSHVTAEIRDIAEVSAYVACLRLLSALPPGHLFSIVDSGGRVAMSGQTRGTGVDAPQRGKPLDARHLDRWAHAAEMVHYGSNSVYWWSFRGEETAEEHQADPRTARQLIDELLDRHADLADHKSIRQSLAGIIGSAKNDALKEKDCEAASLYVRFRSRFAKGRQLPTSLLEDPDFDVWIHKRAVEVADP